MMDIDCLLSINKRVSLFFLFVFATLLTSAQVGINNTTPNATLDVKLTSKNPISTNTPPPGIIAPIVTASALENYLENGGVYGQAQEGAILYISSADIDVDSPTIDTRLINIKTPGYYYFDGNTFNIYASTVSNQLAKQPWYNVETNSGATSNTQNIYQNGQVGVGVNGSIDPNAQLEIASTNKGLIIPRLSKIQRDQITAPTVSMMIWNTDDQCFNIYKGSGSGWKTICENETPAEFTINNCSNSYVAGVYMVGTAANNTNYILMNVSVTKRGSYNIEGTTSIGLYFQRSGSFPAEGNFTILIPAFGSPTFATNEIVPPYTDEADILVNGQSVCKIKIPTIRPAEVTYTIVSNTPESIDKGVATSGKYIDLNLDITVGGTTNIAATENNGFGIIYNAYSQVLEPGTKTVRLFANGASVPISFSGSAVTFTLDALGLSSTQKPYYVNVPVNQITTAKATCTSVVVNGAYVAGKALGAGSTITVNVNVTEVGTYQFEAIDPISNIKFTASGSFGSIGAKTFTATASLVSGSKITADVGNYSFSSTLNTVALCNFSVDVIYPSTTVLLYTVNSNQMRLALTPNTTTNNFSPTGKFKTENLNLIYDTSSWTMTAASLLNYINNKNVQIIIIPHGVTLPSDAQQVLANFITKRKGLVLFSSADDVTQTTNVKGLIEKAYPTSNATINVNNFGSQYFNATIFPTDNANPYLNGVFGEVQRRYYLLYHYNITPDIVLSSSSTVLKSLVSLPAGANVTARDAFVYSTTPGLFVLPGDIYCLGNPNTLYGNYSPIQANTNNIDTYAYSGTPTSSSAYPVLRLTSGMVINWVLFGNIMAEYIKHSYLHYDNSVIVDSN